MRREILILSLVYIISASCTNDSESDLIPMEPENPETVSYEATIKQIIANNCLGCHKAPPINGAPFALDTYARLMDRVENGNVIVAIKRQTGEPAAMPPQGRLPQATIDLIEQWADEGFLEQ
jgi:cytochrome c5